MRSPNPSDVAHARCAEREGVFFDIVPSAPVARSPHVIVARANAEPDAPTDPGTDKRTDVGGVARTGTGTGRSWHAVPSKFSTDRSISRQLGGVWPLYTSRLSHRSINDTTATRLDHSAGSSATPSDARP